MGATTKGLVKDNFGENPIAGTADSASRLADVIIDQKISSHRSSFFAAIKGETNYLDKLSEHHIEVNEIQVYKTLQTPHLITKDYDRNSFFTVSSAVSSFFSYE